MSVLVMSAGRRVGLLRCLRADLMELGLRWPVLAADASNWAAAGQFADELIHMPRVDDPTYADAFSRLCKDRDVALVVPTIDPELPMLAELAPELAGRGTTVLTSGPATVDVTGDKLATYRFLHVSGIPTPHTALLTEVDAAALTFPVVVKPRRGSGSVGVRRITAAREFAALDPAANSLVVQPHVDGDEFTVDVWVDAAGTPVQAVPRLRVETRAGEVSKGVAIDDDQVSRMAMEVAAALPDAFGPLTIQLFRSEQGCQVIEINPRFGGGFPLSWAAGARFTRWALQAALGDQRTPRRFAWEDGLAMLRYDDAVYLPASVLAATPGS